MTIMDDFCGDCDLVFAPYCYIGGPRELPGLFEACDQYNANPILMDEICSACILPSSPYCFGPTKVPGLFEACDQYQNESEC